MSEQLLRFLLTELKTVRIRCQHCKAVVEVTLDRLDKILATGDCPFCQHTLTDAEAGRHQLKALAQAVRDLVALKDQVEVEFVLPAQE